MAGEKKQQLRESFGGRTAFILAAIGSAVGLGNIWRFPYVTYENGGGAFIIPYLIALLTAGIPFLFFEYSIGHKFHGSPPLAFKRLHSKAEFVGWFQVGVCIVIGIYYAAIIAWSCSYMFFSFTKAWGDDPEGFFFSKYLEYDSGGTKGAGISLDLVAQVGWPLVIIWLIIVAIMILGVKKGLAMLSTIFIPLLFIMFAVLVVYSLTLEGAADGLEVLFTPDFSALGDPAVWLAAYGQLFFSLSIGFGIMITYSSYLHRKANITGSGLVVGFSNSSFEVLASLGVFGALGFLAAAQGVGVDEVATDGLGLAFVAFPAIISEVPASTLVGVLFFLSLAIAGLTSLVSILEVVIASVRDKTGMSRTVTVLVVTVPMALVSIFLIGGVSGVTILDVLDYFSNQIGIVSGAIMSIVLAVWFFRKADVLKDNLNAYSSFKVGSVWKVLVGFILPLVLGFLLFTVFKDVITGGYGGYDTWVLVVFGWCVLGLIVVVSAVLSMKKWSHKSAMSTESSAYEQRNNPERNLQ